ncbi:hypothetical protein Tsubulata_014252 [Turnera subulata]|uniref:Uncharacterized protein n=1 Tax=Turnera subulata TaxID=218843 RepID=A0A9Q0JGL8_9ROSI|nr:hypothetical protein Tsubulata_014252 [Turnera subulata]
MSSPTLASKSRLRGVIFDMDGTLTVPAIDFTAMYKAVLGEAEYRRIRSQNPSGIDILHHIEHWPPEKQRRAYEIIVDFERQGLERLQIMPGLSSAPKPPMHLASALIVLWFGSEGAMIVVWCCRCSGTLPVSRFQEY